MGQYSYPAIQNRHEIRLLRLEPGKPGDELSGSIFTTHIDEPSPYEAISYVWGNPNKSSELQTPDGAFAITASLSAALKRLRHTNEPRVLWADAICINQDDATDK